MQKHQSLTTHVLYVFVICGFAAIANGANAAPVAPAPVNIEVPLAVGLPHHKIVEHFAVHDTFDRLALQGSDRLQVMLARDALSLTVNLPNGATLDPMPLGGRRLVALESRPGAAVIRLATGVHVHTWRSNGLLVIDAFGSVQAQPAATRSLSGTPAAALPLNKQSSIAPSHAGQVAESPASATSKRQKPADQTSPQIGRHGTQQVGTQVPKDLSPPSAQPSSSFYPGESEAGAPRNPAAVSLLDETELPGPAIRLPVTCKTAAAAFFRGGEAHIVFDQAQAMDLSLLKDDPVFGSITQVMMPSGTELRFRLPSTAPLHLLQHDGNWAVSLSGLSSAKPSSPIVGHARAGGLLFEASHPGRLVVLDDPVSGGRLLVGTGLEAGQRIAGLHVGAELSVLPTWQGLVLQPASDRVMMRATRDGFEVTTTDAPALSITWPEKVFGAWPDGRVMTRLFDFHNRPLVGQARQLSQALQDVAGLPKAARYDARLRVAQAMLAEGLEVEAAAVVNTAVDDDPRHRNDPMSAGLSAIATWLSAEAGGNTPASLPLDSARLDGSDESALWRALLWPNRPDIAQQAAALATVWPLLLDYPQNLRRFMLQPAAALLAAGGQDKPLKALLAAFPDAAFDSSRARYLQSHGKIDESLALLDKVGQGPDRLARAEALQLAIDERLTLGRLTPAAAADKLESISYAWRGDSREFHLHQRVAQLNAQAGSWRKALTELDDDETLFPDERDVIRQSKSEVISNLLTGDQASKLSALDLVNLASQAAKLPTEVDQSRFAPMLAEKLLALDLPAQAEPIIRGLFSHSKDAKSKAEIGVHLAELEASDGDASGALAVLDDSNDARLAPAAATTRALLRGRLLASLGKSADALASLSNEPDPKARELEVTIMENQHDWKGAARLLDRMLSDHDFAGLSNASQQEVILHAARDLSEAGDLAGSQRLQKTFTGRFKPGPNAALFAVLTSDPVQSTADLARSATEIAAMHALPVSLGRPSP